MPASTSINVSVVPLRFLRVWEKMMVLADHALAPVYEPGLASS